MEIGDLETLESKTQTILSTLEALQNEVTQYQQKNKIIDSALEKLKEASGEMAVAGRGLFEAAEIFRRSDFAEALKAVDARISQLEEAKTAIEDQAAAISVVAERVLAGFEQLGVDIGSLNQQMPVLLEVRQMLGGMAESMESIEGRINRIDQNTQTGLFGSKIRG